MINLEENNIYFYFNKHKIEENFNNFRELGNIYYPLKTNSNEMIIKTLSPLITKAENGGFLISSITHFETLSKEQINPLNMCLINVLVEDSTLRYLYEKGVRFFTFDNMDSLIKFSKYADLSKTKIAVRLSTVQVFNERYTHLGANLEECLKMFQFLKDNQCNNYGISFYIQSNLKAERSVLEKILNHIQENYNNLGIRFFSIGGLNQSKEIDKEAFQSFKRELKLEQVILEIGRYLVEDAIDMETRIIREKTINHTKTVIIKNGIYSGFFDILLYHKKFEMYLLAQEKEKIKIEHERTEKSDYEFILCGGSSDSGDILGKVYIDSKYKNQLTVGAKFLIKNVGAYFEEFFMRYSDDLNKKYI